MRVRWLSGLMAGLALVVSSVDANARCAPGAIGTSREIAIDTRGGPRFGQTQYPGDNLLQPGEVVLTFDDGPHKQLTPVVLEALAQHCAKATFFMVGQRAVIYPSIVREVARAGHTIATHTWSHRNLRQIATDAAIGEIELGISAVQKSLGAPAAPFFRFPYLSDPSQATAHLKQRNTAIFSIDVDSFDFRTRSPSVVMRNVLTQLKSKGRGIILFHDIQPSTAGALGALLSDLKAGGFKIVHLVPRSGQTTLADYDRRIGRDFPASNVASAAVPLDRRSIVQPAWEPRVIPMRPMAGTSGPPVATLQVVPPSTPAALPAAGLASTADKPRRRISSDDDDWRSKVFRNW